MHLLSMGVAIPTHKALEPVAIISKALQKTLFWLNYSAIFRQIPPVLSSKWRKIDLKIQLFRIALILFQQALKKREQNTIFGKPAIDWACSGQRDQLAGK